MVKLYGIVPFDRSGRVRWMLHECGVAFEDVWLDWREEELDAPEFRAISPLGKVPAIEAGETRLCETAVCLEWVGRTYGKGSLDPLEHDPSAYQVWLALASSTIDHVCFEFVRPDIPKEHRPARREQAARDLGRAGFPALEKMLADRDSVLPTGFCAIDIQVAASLHYADRDGRLAEHPRLREWLDVMRARPAAQKAGLFD